ncbi:uncharacterized protein [Watersipora subatra]|uniref:uncharacterized protein n=1 Tax=Watersipora subatra TaxID=2589382 RepID=UPI00355B6313
MACFSGNVRAHVEIGQEGWSRDHLVSQLPPVSTWQREFVIAPAPSGLTGASLGETHIFVSSKPDTTIVITQNGAAPVTLYIPEARGKAFITSLNSFAHVQSNKPIQIAQVFGSQQGRDAAATGDPSMIIYGGINQYSSQPQTTLPPEGHFGYINRVMIIIDRDERTGLRMSRIRSRNLENNGWVSIPNTNLVARCK